MYNLSVRGVALVSHFLSSWSLVTFWVWTILILLAASLFRQKVWVLFWADPLDGKLINKLEAQAEAEAQVRFPMVWADGLGGVRWRK